LLAPVQAHLDFLILFRSGLTITPGLKRDEKEAVVSSPYKAEQAEANNACGVLDAGVLARISSTCLAAALVRSSEAAFGRSMLMYT